MDRRRFLLRGLSAAGALSMLSPDYLRAKEALSAGKDPQEPVPKRRYGRTDQMLSIIGFGGIVVRDETPQDSAEYVARAVDCGVNYFDVAPSYGNAEQRLGPALKPYRDRCFLACKTLMREAKPARLELEQSLAHLETDHFDLYQLHALTTLEEVKQVFAPGGAIETFQKARQAGKVRYLGFSAHSEEAAHAAMDQFDFDSVLFPLSVSTWIKGHFGPSVHRRVEKEGKGMLALKAMAYSRPLESSPGTHRVWKKAWYQPLDNMDKAALGLRFTLHLPVCAMIPPGHWELFKMAVDLARSGALAPLDARERRLVEQMAAASDPLFAGPAKSTS